MLRLLSACLLGLCLSLAVLHPVPVVAQTQTVLTADDYAEWLRTADRAEEAADAGRASDQAMETLREDIAVWRGRFAEAQTANASRIRTLREQLTALGPAPEDGTAESEEIAARRAELNKALSDARVPVLRAEEAHSRADGLIRQIDAIIRERQTNELLQLWPTPLNPVNWEQGARALIGTGAALGAEISGAWNSDVQRGEARANLPVTLLLLAIALVLMLRGHYWMEALARRMLINNTRALRWILGFAASLGQIVLPFIGVIALTEALYSTNLIGIRGDIVLSALPAAALAFLIARWLGVRIFPRRADRVGYLNLRPEKQAQGRWLAATLGTVLGIQILLFSIAEYEGYNDTAMAVIAFPILVVFATLTFRLGQLLRRHAINVADAAEDAPYRARLLKMLGGVVMLLTVTGVLLGAVGYMLAAGKLVFPTGMSLALIAFLMMLQRMVTEVYGLVTGNRDTASEALTPVLLGFVLVLAATPVMALIWGARVATLTEIWTSFLNGVSFGDTTISPTAFLTLAVIFSAGYVLTRLLQGALRSTVLPKTKLDTGGRNAIVSGTGYLGIFLSALLAITGAGIDLSSLAIVFGALSVGIGFGLQNIVSNFVSGIILLIERPISEGDWIEVSGKSGYVRSISVRSTRIETFDRSDVIVPNSDLISGVVMNMTKGSLTGRVIVPVGVAYGNDTRKVESILREIAEAHPMVVLNPPPGVVFQGFGADSLDFEIRAILRDVNWMLSVKSDMNHEIARRFAEEGIEIPFAQRDIWIRNPETLLNGGKPTSAPATNPPSDTVAEVDFADNTPGDDD